MKYDDASWHSGGDFPNDLPASAGATHIAVFLAWAVLNGMAGDTHIEDFQDDLAKLQRREITPGEWFLGTYDGKFTDEDLNLEGNEFASAYYGNEDGLRTAVGSYFDDYDKASLKRKSIFSRRKSLYHLPDTWQTFSDISLILDARYAGWRNGG